MHRARDALDLWKVRTSPQESSVSYTRFMPLFEYACQACEREFEALVRGHETPECPSCHSTKLERQQSTFAARSANGSSSSPLDKDPPE